MKLHRESLLSRFFSRETWKRIPPSEVEWLISAMTNAGIRRDWKKSKRFYQRVAAFDVSREFSEDETKDRIVRLAEYFFSHV